MKHKASVYAKALAIADPKKFKMESFLRLLEKNGDAKKLKEVIALAEKMLLAKNGNKKIVIETARPLKKKIAIAKKGDVVEEKISPGLIAGMKVIVDGERQLDFSMKNILDNIF